MLKKNTLLMILLFSVSAFFNAGAQTLTAKEIVKKADEKNRGLTSQGEMTMTIVRPTWSRSISMKSWAKGTTYAMVLITSPAQDKGQVFLKIKTDMWNWLPSIERMIKIPPSMMMQSWMGSDFTNDDLVKESSIVTDYNQHLLGKEEVRGMLCYKIELIPLPDAAVTWGKVIMWVTVNGFNEWKAEYYDEDMTLINVMNAYNIRRMGDRDIPTRLEIIPVEHKDQKTILETQSAIFNQPISTGFFSQQNMKQLSEHVR
ncbi:outer membrane lipoprotein-sorting protein [Microbacter margulisiae]|uniref:Outer membrane lipoprotein-sorting protein n=1 Tax=Microbacter margulisiae TaxID=1350067 RepID=A0A7W5DSX1_9PORP|nr:outer membrane lipoprotein-sorting protein [Microbacter margulisiae]MBB3188153.1 outer membrane lipoprotein-sorting protein [Microbacter margulisiae]